MSDEERIAAVAELKRKLVELEARFQTEARHRGFDPAQIQNMALPAALAGLAGEYAEIKAELEEIES